MFTISNLSGNVGSCCGDGITRYAPEGLQILPHPNEPGRVVLAATDGHCLAVVTADVKGVIPAGGAVVPQTALPKNAAERKADCIAVGESGQRTYAIPPGVGRARDSLGIPTSQGVTWRETPRPESCFPRWDAVLPTSLNGRIAIKLNVQQLANLGEALTTSEDHSLTLLIDPQEPGEVVCVSGPAGIGVLMPVWLCEPGNGEAAAAYACTQFLQQRQHLVEPRPHNPLPHQTP